MAKYTPIWNHHVGIIQLWQRLFPEGLLGDVKPSLLPLLRMYDSFLRAALVAIRGRMHGKRFSGIRSFLKTTNVRKFGK